MAKRKSKRKLPESETLPQLKYVEFLLEGHGDITLGQIATINCVATAADEDQQLAMLIRRDGESLGELLVRLDKALYIAYEKQQYIDEVNDGPDYSI